MIPIDLVKVRVWKGYIKPSFLKIDDLSLRIAHDVITAFKVSIGKKKIFLMDRLDELEDIYDHKVVRGLASILEKRCVFEKSSTYNPYKLRKEVFLEAEKLGGVYTEEQRKEVLRKVAEKTGLSVKELEEGMWSDLEEERVFKNFSDIEPLDLVKLYNLSLIQSLLLRAINLDVKMKYGWKEVLRRAKRLGLMYTAYLDSFGLHVTFDGPSSIVKLTERYGASLAKLIPLIVKRDGWYLSATVLRRTERGKRMYKMNLSYKEVEGLLPKEESEPITFDSSIEERFFYEFSSIRSGWEIYREESPLIAGRSIFLPDFKLSKDDLSVYLEIVGFWTPEYVRRKLDKISKLRDVKLIIAINEELACSEVKELGHEVITFKGKVPVEEVLKTLRKFEIEVLKEQVRELKKLKLSVKGDVVNLRDIAHGYSVEAVKEVVKGLNGYRLIGNQLVSELKLKEIDEKLSTVNLLYDAMEIIRKEGIEDYGELLRSLGYKIEWVGLDGKLSRIKKESRVM